MFAVIKVAGFQYRVEKDQVLRVPLLEAEEGATLTLDEVLLVQDGASVKVGTPTVEGASVSAQVMVHARTPKLVAGKFKRRRKYRRRWGHRQDYTEIRIDGIQG
jgi:large subunit ribosomal protein L21